MTAQLIHSDVPRSLRPVISEWTSGDLSYPKYVGGSRVLAPTWENIQEWAPEYQFTQEFFYKRFASLTIKPDRPAPPSEIFRGRALSDELKASLDFKRGQAKEGFSIKFKPFKIHPGCVRMDFGLDLSICVAAGMMDAGSVVVTPTMSGVVITRSYSGATVRVGRHPRFLGPPIAYRMPTAHPRPIFYSAEVLEEGVILAHVPQEDTLRYFGVIVN